MSEAQTVESGGEGTQGLTEGMAARLGAVKKASATWTGQLVDLTGRNNLLYFRDLKVGTLPLDDASPRYIYEALQGKTVQLSKLFADPEAREDCVKRARAVHNKSKANYEERGLATLYLACGMATWTAQKSASVPASPVLLVPIQLSPKGGAQEEFELSVTGELEVNPTFLQMLKAEFSVECDPAELLAHSGIEGIIDTPEELDTSFEWLSEQCRAVPGFDVNSRFVVGNFSYARMPMVRDLENSVEAMAEHDIVAALAGDRDAQEALLGAGASAEIPSPDFVPPADEFLVLDADSSQNYAINAVLAGRNLIIKGPPGTGKSQTISNLVSTLVARGKRVLFVAEKRAAIDAVLRRLNDAGLGDLVLDLHGGVSSKRETAQALATAFNTNAQLAKPNLSDVHHRLEQRRETLNRRVRALHDHREPWGISFFEVQARLIGMPESVETDLRFRGEALQRLGGDVLRQLGEDLGRFVGLGGPTVRHSESPWGRASIVSAEEAEAVQADVRNLRQQLPAVLSQLRTAAAEVGMAEPSGIGAWRDRLDLWQQIAEFRKVFSDEVFGLDLGGVAHDVEPAAGSIAARASASVFSGDYREAKKLLRGCVQGEQKLSAAELYLGAIDAQGLVAAWAELGGSTDGSPREPANLEALMQGLDAIETRLARLGEKLGRGPIQGDEASICQVLDALLSDVATLSKLPEVHRLEKALRAGGLGELLDRLEGQAVGRSEAIQTLEYAWLASLVEHMQLSDTTLGAFDGDQHREIVSEYQVADREHIETTPQRVRRMCAEQAVAAQDADSQGAQLVKAEASKKRRHRPVRQLFSAAPEILTSLKPCWAMSPLVVSQVLPSDQPHFDVVVFDEASQIRPADAMPAILRGKQLVVAGDERQLPPTSFFAGTNLDVAEEEDEIEAGLAVDTSYESILEALQAFVAFRMLEWHYRSRDERLIAFSNVYLYDRGLTTFPGIVGPDCVQHVAVPFVAGEPGSEASSSAEVERVVELIIEHAEQRPGQTLGVIAMGIKHANRVEEALREALHGREDLDEFFHEARHEPFFIKNLERVQGDERDAIILSVGYGKSPDGRLFYRFGPLNQEGGERRLNVAVTRAKQRMTLVSSFTHLDMDPERSSAKGVLLLRAYLEYCSSNGSQLGEIATEIPELNPFEVDVRDSLEREGVPLVAQYGSSGYRIDFAAKHPTQPGRMVLAIECDGASYHSTPSARDRDRLRQEHLERLGWQFHRIWSQDWFNNKPEEIKRAKAAYNAALEAADNGGRKGSPAQEARDVAGESGGDELITLTDVVEVPERGPCPILFRQRDSIDDYERYELVELVKWIESDTLPRTKDAVLDEAIKTLGFKRRGKKIVAALEQAIAAARR